MITTIDAAGRIVVPKRMRDRLGLVGGVEVEIEEHDGAIEIRLGGEGARLVPAADGRGLVVEAPPNGATPTDADLQRLVDEGRGWPRT